jgi:alginate O-acetyltransferase complex protein AlgI
VLFNSIHFLFFFPLVAAAFFLTAPRWRWLLLLAASYYFYASWRVDYVLLLFASTSIDYFAALGMERHTRPRPRRLLLGASLAGNLGLLFWFKYAAFASGAVGLALSPLGVVMPGAGFSPLLPIGISFYTFQTISYSIDVYRRTIPAQRHFGRFALYVSFFPQLVAGPIERAGRLMPQFERVQRFDVSRARSGVALMAWGFFQKLVIADRLALHVNAVYNAPDGHTAGAVLLATYFFAFQIYADFAGYSNIAIGAARVLGFQLRTNFRQPYLALSLAELWSRWHISLTSWFRDYLYATIRDRENPSRMYWARNILVVFLATGLWHGAAWNFVVFGALTGAAIVAGALLRPWREAAWARAQAAAQRVGHRASTALTRGRPIVASVATFHVAAFLLLFFRANTLADAGTLLGAFAVRPTFAGTLAVGLPLYQLSLALAGIAVLMAVDLLVRTGSPLVQRAQRDRWARWGLIYATIFATLMFGEFRTIEFIYFQF